MSSLTICIKALISCPTLEIMPSITHMYNPSCTPLHSRMEVGRNLKLHDSLQHIRALGTLGCYLPGTFITSMIELKLNVDTPFEW